MRSQEDLDDEIILAIYARRAGCLSEADIQKGEKIAADFIADAVRERLV